LAVPPQPSGADLLYYSPYSSPRTTSPNLSVGVPVRQACLFSNLRRKSAFSAAWTLAAFPANRCPPGRHAHPPWSSRDVATPGPPTPGPSPLRGAPGTSCARPTTNYTPSAPRSHPDVPVFPVESASHWWTKGRQVPAVFGQSHPPQSAPAAVLLPPGPGAPASRCIKPSSKWCPSPSKALHNLGPGPISRPSLFLAIPVDRGGGLAAIALSVLLIAADHLAKPRRPGRVDPPKTGLTHGADHRRPERDGWGSVPPGKCQATGRAPAARPGPFLVQLLPQPCLFSGPAAPEAPRPDHRVRGNKSRSVSPESWRARGSPSEN